LLVCFSLLEFEMGDGWVTGGAVICFCIVFLTGVILFSVSFDTLDPHVCGIKYSNVQKDIDDRIYNNGRYFVGLGSYFLTYPVTLQNINYGSEDDSQITCWTREGQEVNIDVSWWYRLQRNHVIDIYHRYNDDFHSRLIQIGVGMVKEVCSNYTAEDFFLKRRQIGGSMLDFMRARYEQEWATIEIFNLRKIGIPSRFEDKVIEKVVTAQHQKTAVNVREIALRQSAINVILGDGQARINQTQFEADATGALLVARAQASGLLSLRQQEASSYAALQDVLGLDAHGLLQYRWAQTANKLTSARDGSSSSSSDGSNGVSFMVGFSSPIVKVRTSSSS